MTAQSLKQIEREVCERFKNEFGAAPERIVLSPGRVNIIGDHTDYNDGFVLPMAIDRYLVMAVSRRNDDMVRVVSTDFKGKIEFAMSQIRKGEFTWGEYITGCLWGLQEQGYTPCGFDMVVTANIPVGASLSSSAALELGILRAAAYSSGLEWNPLEMALLGQKVENEWVGMNCGIMDQAICACGKMDHALLIDCRDLSLRACPLPPNSSVVVMDTTTRRGLVDSAYNERREQCFKAAQVMEIAMLRDGDEALLEHYRGQMPELSYLRARHIISENSRVIQAAEAMKTDADEELGRLMYASHVSLRDDFDVSGAALNIIVECAMEHPACLGARMTGAGFAGCAVALVKKGGEEDFVRQTKDEYQKRMDVEPQLYVCMASDGTGIKQALAV